MAKKRAKALAIILGAMMTAASVFGGVGCKPPDSIKIDKNKTQLYIGTYGGGFGVAFLEDLKIRFEEYAAEASYEEGKTGVQVFYQEDKDKYNASNLKDTISYDSNELYFLNGDELNDFLAGNKIREITKAVTEPLTEYDESKSIADKMRDEQVNHHLRGGKYYSIPFTESTLGVIYDVDVFDQYKLYIAKDGAPSEKLQPGSTWTEEDGYTWCGLDAERSAGPDGKYETEYDNGLPATLEDFEKLIDRMSKRGVDSIIWTGQYADTYTSFLPRAFHVNYHGAEESRIFVDGQARDTKLVKEFKTEVVNGKNVLVPEIETVSVGMNNIKEIARQAGYYYGLNMFETMINSGTVSNYAWQDLSHVRTQEKFLISNFRNGETPIAFMIDGAWWENEADSAGTFIDNVTEFGNGASRQNRRFGLFCMPNATTEDLQARINGKKGAITGGGGSIVVNANVPDAKMDLIEDFIRFAMTDESLNRFMVNTSLPTPYEVELDPEYEKQMTYFAKNYYQIYKNSEVFYSDHEPHNLSISSDFLNVRDNVQYQSSNKPGEGIKYGLFPTEVKYNSVTAKDYFEGIYRRVK